MMRAGVLHAFGSAPRFEEFPAPTAAAGETLVRVKAAAITPLARWIASDRDYGRSDVPFICGSEGVGELEDGSRVSFGVLRAPYGAMAEVVPAPTRLCTPIVRDDVDDVLAAAVKNPGVSAFNSLGWGAKLQPGENVLVLGATGVAGRLAVQVAKLLGAGKVIAAGRDESGLEVLQQLGADELVPLGQSDSGLGKDFRRITEQIGVQVVLDYLWGRPAQVLLDAMPRRLMADREIRYLQLGNSAGATISLHANALRRTGVTLGAGAPPPVELVQENYRKVLDGVASGRLRIDCAAVPLSEIEAAWQQDTRGRRLVVVP
ncbi:zinc-binding alcohol dehydrogenase family protein [Saccharopolyspora indica]|uniref:quinone oxidoreductase family protein n=1 Tax=Saccharopolyspora indica TaxID=1229659 RepID=UPI0022EAA247|nr:zinc-binding alcohol dehydrogenase family protein [Saccharopolyspora indica]MDA3647924.1 zinc-binding alcohol dehydrogenase family protein [Saccharopolyspora indica]